MKTIDIQRFAPNSVELRAIDAREMVERVRLAKIVLQTVFTSVNIKFDLSIMQATNKSQVYVFELGCERVVAKFFEKTKDFECEVGGYLLWRGGPIQRLIYQNIKEKLLITSFANGKPFEHSMHSAAAVAKGLGHLHLAAQRNFERLPTHLRSQRTVGFLRAKARGNHSTLLDAWMRLVGEEYVPIALGDLKPEHALIHRGICNFVDLETTCVGQLQLHDLLCLSNFVNCSNPFFYFWRNNLSDEYIKASGLGTRGVTSDLLTQVLCDYATLRRESGAVMLDS
jgi:hypothetical protein